MANLLRQTALRVRHPTIKGRSLWDAVNDTGKLFGDVIDNDVLETDQAAQISQSNFGIKPLGSGSDYTVFLQHLGVSQTRGGAHRALIHCLGVKC